MINKAFMQWVEQISWLLEYEPNWFSEFGFAIGSILWGICCLMTDNVIVSGWAYVLPIYAIIIGFVRSLVLLQLWYGPRVVLSALNALLVAWLLCGLSSHYRLPSTGAWLIGVFLIEILNTAKFSIPCARELWEEYKARHNA